jgi:phosphopantetheinyl transferase
MSVVPVNVTPHIGRVKPCAAGAPWQPPRVVRRYRPLSDLDALLAGRVEGWLSARELKELAQWRDERRRRAWMLSRLLARQLLAEVGDASEASFEVLSRDELGRVNRPILWRDGARLPWSLSISHSDRGVLVALAPRSDVTIGADVTQEQSFAPSLEAWFTPSERAW